MRITTELNERPEEVCPVQYAAQKLRTNPAADTLTPSTMVALVRLVSGYTLVPAF